MPAAGQRFSLLPGVFAVCRLGPGDAVPGWAAGEFASITRTPDELSIVCLAERVPSEVQAARDWRVLKIAGPFSFSTVGILASLAAPLAQAGISLLTISTYDTDYLLVKRDALERAVAVLGSAGHQLVD